MRNIREIEIKIKPLSVNQAWQGRRFKSDKYKTYEKEMLLLLPDKIRIPEFISINLILFFSNKKSDIDNPIKPILDILQKKYGFNDSAIYELNVLKRVCKKGEDKVVIYISDSFVSL
jgi:Holliday junction resolvase RusA-like endonuclease